MSATPVTSELTPLALAMEENLHGHIAFVQRRLPGMFVDDREDLLLVDSGLPTDTFNKICRARLGTDDADARIAQAITHFKNSGRPFSWWVGPGSRPLDLEACLQRHGLGAAERELGMAIEMSRLPPVHELPKGAEIRAARTREGLRDFAGVMADCFTPPCAAVTEFFERAAPVLLKDECPMKFFVGYVDGVPAAGSELYLGGDVAGVHMVATRIQFQRRGLGLALTWTALNAARPFGVATATLQASDQGVPVYRRLGFREVCRFVEYTLA
jgi:ribosomal protein S18 acetylase RimI-like enzyme